MLEEVFLGSDDEDEDEEDEEEGEDRRLMRVGENWISSVFASIAATGHRTRVEITSTDVPCSGAEMTCSFGASDDWFAPIL